MPLMIVSLFNRTRYRLSICLRIPNSVAQWLSAPADRHKVPGSSPGTQLAQNNDSIVEFIAVDFRM